MESSRSIKDIVPRSPVRSFLLEYRELNVFDFVQKTKKKKSVNKWEGCLPIFLDVSCFMTRPLCHHLYSCLQEIEYLIRNIVTPVFVYSFMHTLKFISIHTISVCVGSFSYLLLPYLWIGFIPFPESVSAETPPL